MKRQWEKFEGQQYRRTARKEPRVSLNRTGTFYLNGYAFDAMEQPGAVEMFYDGNNRVIGLKPVDPSRRNAFAIKHHGRAGNYKRISASAFCSHFRLSVDRTVLFNNIDLDNDGVLILDLRTAVNIGRGAR